MKQQILIKNVDSLTRLQPYHLASYFVWIALIQQVGYAMNPVSEGIAPQISPPAITISSITSMFASWGKLTGNAPQK